MTVDELRAVLAQFPGDGEVYIRQGDNAWPLGRVRRFTEGDGDAVAYLQPAFQFHLHRNFPEGYDGVEEIEITHGEETNSK